MLIAWHGAAALSLDTGQTVITVDPHFSPASLYGDWYTANSNAPDWSTYLERFRANHVLITHGHFDHFDLHSIGRFVRDTDCEFVSTPEVLAVIAREFAPGPNRLISALPGQTLTVDDISITPVAGVHWLTGREGDAIAERLANRPDRYGAMPCGGAALGFLISVSGVTVYLSGDTRPEGIPDTTVDIAVLAIAGRIPHPRTGELCTPALTIDDIPLAAARLSPVLIIPVHFDLDLFDRRITSADVTAAPATVPVQVLPYNTWVPVSHSDFK